MVNEMALKKKTLYSDLSIRVLNQHCGGMCSKNHKCYEEKKMNIILSEYQLLQKKSMSF